MFDGRRVLADKDPRKSLHVRRRAPPPSWRPTRPYVAVMASSINFNTVWTSIFEPLPDLRLPRPPRQGERVGRPPRPAVPRGRLRRLGRRAAGRLGGAQLEAGRPGHGPLQLRRRPGPVSAHDDSMLAANQRIWGFETNFGGLADLTVVKANQLMPKPPTSRWEEAAVNALCNSTSYRMLVSPQRGADEAGRRGAGLGRDRRPRRLRRAVRPQRRRHPGRRGVLGREGRRCSTSSAVEAVIDRKAAGYQFWADEHTQDEREWRRLGKDIRGLIGGTPTSSSSTPAARPSARRCSSPPAAARSSPAPPPPAT